MYYKTERFDFLSKYCVLSKFLSRKTNLMIICRKFT
jgi:hypothetical protein